MLLSMNLWGDGLLMLKLCNLGSQNQVGITYSSGTTTHSIQPMAFWHLLLIMPNNIPCFAVTMIFHQVKYVKPTITQYIIHRE